MSSNKSLFDKLGWHLDLPIPRATAILKNEDSCQYPDYAKSIKAIYKAEKIFKRTIRSTKREGQIASFHCSRVFDPYGNYYQAKAAFLKLQTKD